MSKKNTAATIATIIVAVLAIATTLFLLYQTSQQQIQDNQYNYIPSDEVNEEMNMNAVTLIKNNCEIFRIDRRLTLWQPPSRGICPDMTARS